MASGFENLEDIQRKKITPAKLVESLDLDNPTGSTVSGLLSVHNLTYSFYSGPPCRPKKKTLLRNVNAVFHNGLNALMGPTGAGKSTFLDLMANRRSRKGMLGRILLDAEPILDNFFHVSGYVTQEDIVMGTLTVKENLLFAANLKMRHCSDEAKQQCVQRILDDLGLSRCENTRIGNEIFKGVSGGERKRCCIGMELVTKPKVLFLDEPTTGLDSSMALSVISFLREVALKGPTTVIFSIHQPRYSVFKHFDKVHLLSNFGQTVYFGSAHDSVSYFRRHGFLCDRHDNPADFFLDVIINKSSTDHSSTTSRFCEKTPSDDNHGVLDLVRVFAHSDEAEKLERQCQTIVSYCEQNPSTPYYKSLPLASNCFQQFRHLSKRSLINATFSPRIVIGPTVISIIVALFFGWLTHGWTYNMAGFYNLFGALVFLVIQPVMATFVAIDIILAGQKFFNHEIAKGYYTLVPYLASKVLIELFLLCAVPCFFFTSISYICIGLRPELPAYFAFLGVNELGALSSCCLIFFVTVASGSVELASAIVPALLVLMVLFSGIFINVSTVKSFMQVFVYLSIPRQMLVLQANVQYEGTQFCGVRNFLHPVTSDGNSTEHVLSLYACERAEDLLKVTGIESGFEEQMKHALTLLAFPLVLMPLTCIVLKIRSKF